MMSEAEFAVNFFIALFALIDPVGNVPMFAAATMRATPPARRLTAFYISAFVLAFLTLFYLTGIRLLEFFGISLPAFRIAGGILLLLLGLDMARGQVTADIAEVGSEGEPLSTRAYAIKRFEGLITPFAMPLLIGPGAISTVIISAGEARRFGLQGVGVGIAVMTAVALATLVAFWLSGAISRILGRIGMIIVVRVLGLILCAMAVQFMLSGFSSATVGLMRPEVATPYGR
jgi:multiple antibiotic resistance protein